MIPLNRIHFYNKFYYQILRVIYYRLDLIEENEELESLLLLIFDSTEDKFIELFEERINVDFIKCLQIFSLIYKKKNPRFPIYLLDYVINFTLIN